MLSCCSIFFLHGELRETQRFTALFTFTFKILHFSVSCFLAALSFFYTEISEKHRDSRRFSLLHLKFYIFRFKNLPSLPLYIHISIHHRLLSIIHFQHIKISADWKWLILIGARPIVFIVRIFINHFSPSVEDLN